MIQTACRDCGKPVSVTPINAAPECADCTIRRRVEEAPDECNYCSSVPVAFIANGDDPLYLCREHSDEEHPDEVRYFRDFGGA